MNNLPTLEEQVDQLCDQILDDEPLSWERSAIADALQERDRIAYERGIRDGRDKWREEAFEESAKWCANKVSIAREEERALSKL